MNIFNQYTLKTLKKNKTRTLVTIIGIILSASMITAVTTFVSSLQTFLVSTVIENDGNWHGTISDASYETLDKLKDSTEVSKFGTLQNMGYSLLEESQNAMKPYLSILGYDTAFKEMMPIDLISGRMPENSTEIILPKHLETNGNIKHQLGEVLNLSIGYREYDKERLTQSVSYYDGENGLMEEFVITHEQSFTIVGFYERPTFEPYSAPGYSALTVSDNNISDSYSIYIHMNNPRDIFAFIKTNLPDAPANYNYSLLRYIGASDENSFNAVLYGLAYILIGIIMFASISLIYNAFSISVSERIKQFGILSSVGATKKQLMKSVIFEATFLSCIGVPLGILAGITGIGITLRLTRNLFMSSFINSKYSTITLKLDITVTAIVIAILVSFITVLISAFLPAKKAVKISAIDAIRQTSDINIKPRKVKTSKLTYQLFGFEGMIASKNFKRNRRKYRATVISLFVSVVLFITASSFCAYLEKSVTTLATPKSFDIAYFYNRQTNINSTLDDIYTILTSQRDITKKTYISPHYVDVRIKSEHMSKEYINFLSRYNSDIYNNNDKSVTTFCRLTFINDIEYKDYLEANGFDKNKYLNPSNPVGIAYDFVKYYSEDGKYYTYNMLNGDKYSADLLVMKDIDGYYYTGSDVNSYGETIYYYQEDTNTSDDTNNILELTESEAIDIVQLNIGAKTEKLPFGIDSYTGDNLIIMYPYSAMQHILSEYADNSSTTLFFKSSDHKVSYEAMYQILEENALPTNLNDFATNLENDRAMVLIVNVFSYGFIVLISLIAAANVFNTISTNINLRRREFAMLKSIGMTQKGFHKMMNYECALYGIKGLLYGIPVSIVSTYLIYQVILNGWETDFFIPAHSIIIAIASVFIVVFSTMLYSMKRIKNENTIDALKNENL